MLQNKISVLFLLCILMFAYFGCSNINNSDGTISYNKLIRPILSDKCFVCHGPDQSQRISGYRLDLEEFAFAKLKQSPNEFGLVVGNPSKSEVYQRIISHEHDYMMPPPDSKLALSEDEKNIIKKWIEQGAKYEPHWAFTPVKKPSVPKAMKKNWTFSEIDQFALAKMEENNLKPSEIDHDLPLLKRMMHDLKGLPPSLKEMEEYTKNQNLANYEKMVDKALASPQYGEKMAIFWMDIARYADSHGYQDDGLRTMWPWRDWVIHAFNQNYPYKKFLSWQLAGDLLPDANKETILATGFNRNHKITQEGGVIDEEYRIEYVTDRTNTFGKGILAMTFECAKCHDHKYDPISQKDYYSTFAFFNQIDEKGLVGDISLASLADPPYMTITKEDRQGILNFISKLDTGDVRVMVMKDSTSIRNTHILNRGAYDQPTEVVRFNTPKAIFPFDSLKYEKNRLGLAKWLFDKKNPLTSRVFVNNIWQEFFGNGIVKTNGDFGLQGDLPSHPELLDWLAADFIEHGWDIKRLVKQIVMSATYRQSNTFANGSIAVDPENTFLSRGPRLKLSAELLKDHIMATSELLNPVIGGPSVKPYQPKGLWENATSGRGQLATYEQDTGDKLYRRGLYHFIKRTVPPPSMLIFDGANRDQCEVKRSKTNTPLQALVLMNDPQVLEATAVLSNTLSKKHKNQQEAIFEEAFLRIVCRKPLAKEKEILNRYFASVQKSMTKEKAQKLIKVGEKMQNEKIENPIEVAGVMQTIQLIYNLEEASVR
jgi:hypothetical protein